MNFIIFNIILVCFSLIIDYIAVDLYGLVEWTSSYINYLVFINLPISLIATYLSIGKVKTFLGIYT
jgi:hypothetical protein